MCTCIYISICHYSSCIIIRSSGCKAAFYSMLCTVHFISHHGHVTDFTRPPVAGGCGGPKPPRRRVSFGTHHGQWDDVAAAADDDDDVVVVVVVVSYCCFYLFQERMMAKTSEDLVPVSIILEGLLHALRSAPEAGSSLFGCSGGDCSTVNLCLLWGWHVGSRRSELISFKSWGQIWVWAKNGSAKPPNYGILWNTMEYPAIKPHLNPKMDGFRSNMTNLCLGRSPFCLHPCVCGSDPAGCAHTPRHDAFAACAGAGRMRCRDDV